MRLFLLFSLTLVFLMTPSFGQTWESDIRPLLQKNCSKCHGGAKQKGGLDLRSEKSAIAGGESGPAIVPMQPEQSLLIQVLGVDADPHMPPKKQLPPEDIERLRAWIAHLGNGVGELAQESAASSRMTDIPAGIDPSLATDLFIQAKWKTADVRSSGRCSDATYVRRVYIDLLGRIPTRGESEAFLVEANSQKRATLVDRLIESEEHAAHLADIFNVVFLERADDRTRKREARGAWLDYLRWAFKSNRPWDEIGRDLIVARPRSQEEGGASWFLYEQGDDHQRIATRTSATLLGKQVQCAQCHDHPVSPEIEQRHYWGLVSFFSRSVNVKTPDGPRVAERANGGYAKFSNVQGKSSETELVMLGGPTIEEPGGRRDEDRTEFYEVAPPEQWFKKLKKEEKLKKDLDALPIPKFSRREEFARAATGGNPDFSRAIVNRIWAIVFGRGLVHPVDQMDSAHPPSHPHLLDWLARDFAENGHDLRRLIRALMKTQAYQLDFHPADSTRLPPQDLLFARALDKPLSGEALYRSMRIAAGHGHTKDESMRKTIVETFPDLFAEVYSPSVQQAMFVSNGRMIDQLLCDESPLIQELTKLESATSLIDEAFLQILGRKPDQDESTRSIEFLNRPSPQSIRQFCWALLASAEFRINH